MRHPLRSTLLLLLLYVAGMGVLNGCQEAAERRHVQTQKARDGSMLKEESFYIKNGKHVLHGTQRLWFKNGQLRRETEYVDGHQHGRMTEWYKSGTKAEEGTYQNGLREGLWQGWYEGTGAKYWEATYADGHIVGEKVYWYESGRYRSGLLQGKDLLEGKETYDSEGHIQRKTRWYPDGRMWMDGTFRKGRKHGTWTYWEPDGTVKAQGEWRDGKPWEGMCGVRMASDAGRMFGLLVFEEYHEGRPTGRIAGWGI